MHLPSRLLPAFIILPALTLSACKTTEPDIILGFSANQLCSRLFISHEDQSMIENQVLGETLAKLSATPTIAVDHDQKSVSVATTVEGESIARSSVYREGLGCTLVLDDDPTAIDQQSISPLIVSPSEQDNYDLPKAIDSTIDLNAFFAETSAISAYRYNTFAVAVAHNGNIVAEQYDDNHHSEMRMLSWSMAKTITALLTGVLHDQGQLTLNEFVTLPNTVQQPTVKQLLNMSSGLQWDETGAGGTDDLGSMWYQHKDSAAYAAAKPEAYTPGTRFDYSTGTAQLLSRFISDKMGSELQDVYNFYQTAFFHKLGIYDAVVEHDPSGTFRGGARVFMKPKDWLKIGQLIINKGNWHGQQLVSEYWIDEMLTASDSSDLYGGQLWLNDMGLLIPSLPDDTVSLRGHKGQYLVIIPSENLVVARLGAYGSNVNGNIGQANYRLMKQVNHVLKQLP